MSNPPLVCTRNDPAGIAATFAEYGVVILPGLFSAVDLAAAQAALLAWASAGETLRPYPNNPAFAQHETRVISWWPIGQGQTCFAALRDHPHLASATQAAVGPGAPDGGYIGEGCMVMLSRPGDGQAWHQDTANDEPDQFFVNRLLYPWDVDPAAGALVCVPGSHRSGRIPPGAPHGSMPGELQLAPTAGSVVLVHSRCFHRVTANRTGNHRFSVNFRIRPASATADFKGIGVYRTGAYDFTHDRPVLAS